MAVRSKPAWDIPLDQIDARASRLKLDRDYFARQPQARADSVEHSQAEREILRALVQNMTADQILAYSAAMQRGENVDITAFMHARADAESVQGGLKMTTRIDESGRPIREFSNSGARKVWMDPYRTQPQLMVRINKRADPPGAPEATAYLTAWEETQRQIADGTYTLPEL